MLFCRRAFISVASNARQYSEMNKKITTLCLLHQNGRSLLGMKKRGFGKDRWNGFGGKVLPGEDIEQAAKREMSEECGLIPTKLSKLGYLVFDYPAGDEKVEMHIFRVIDFSGRLQESEEMLPRWFDFNDIPYEQMWPDDKFWMPLFLAGKSFRGSFLFDENYRIIKHELEEI